MKKFKPYPIYINDADMDHVRLRQRDEFVEKGDFEMMNWLDNTGKRLYEVSEIDPRNQSQAQRDYEDSVERQLKIISQTMIGKLLLDSISQNSEKVWIVPLDAADRNQCSCGAYTFPGQPKERGGIRIYYNPSELGRHGKYITPHDILFHELVHAYRMGEVGYVKMRHTDLFNYGGDGEELFALVMQNVYLADTGKTFFYSSYGDLTRVTMDSAYNSLKSDLQAFSALTFFQKNEPMVTRVAQWQHLIFNPWRDYSMIERSVYGNIGKNIIPRILR